MKSLLSVLGILFVVVAAGAGIGLGTLPAGRLKAAVTALKGAEGAVPPTAPVPTATSDLLPADAGVLTEARARLLEAKEDFRQERAMAEAQLRAERSEIDALKAAVEARVEELARTRSEAAAPASRPAAAGAGKGAKAVAELTAKMSPKDVVHLLQDESEAEVARILGKMDARQAGKVMSELVAADAERARKVMALMKEGR